MSEIGIGVAAGIGAGLLGGWLFAAAVKRGWTSTTGEQIGNLALALCAFWAAKALGGNGFVAAFVGGVRRQPGAAVAAIVHAAGPPYSLLSLTLIRLIPVAVSMIRTRLRLDTVLVMGWFGPRGLASVVFLLMAYESFHKAGRNFDLLADAAAWTVLLSVALHGLTAVPLANWYARRLETAETAAPELMTVPEPAVRRRDPLGWLKRPL